MFLQVQTKKKGDAIQKQRQTSTEQKGQKVPITGQQVQTTGQQVPITGQQVPITHLQPPMNPDLRRVRIQEKSNMPKKQEQSIDRSVKSTKKKYGK